MLFILVTNQLWRYNILSNAFEHLYGSNEVNSIANETAGDVGARVHLNMAVRNNTLYVFSGSQSANGYNVCMCTSISLIFRF